MIVYLEFISGCPNAGTLSVQDVLTDLGAEEVDLFLGGKADGKLEYKACSPLSNYSHVFLLKIFLKIQLQEFFRRCSTTDPAGYTKNGFKLTTKLIDRTAKRIMPPMLKPEFQFSQWQSSGHSAKVGC